jgi:hypothetical protein
VEEIVFLQTGSVAHPPSHPVGSSVLSLRIKWLEHEAYQGLVSIMCGMLPHLPLMLSQSNPYAQEELDLYECIEVLIAV